MNAQLRKLLWAQAVVTWRLAFERDYSAINRIRWAIARDQLRSD